MNEVKIFRCMRCMHEFKRKDNLKCHLFRKKPCSVKFKDIDIKYLQENPQESQTSAYMCNICSKTFTRKDNVIRHQTICETRQKSSECVSPETLSPLFVKKSYGKEDTCHLSEEMICEITQKGTISNAILKIISEIHFNRNTPQNSNIKLANERRKYAEIYNSNTEKWEKIPKREFIRDLIHKVMVIIEDAFENSKNTKSNTHKKFEKEYFDKKYNSFHRNIENRVECFLINNS